MKTLLPTEMECGGAEYHTNTCWVPYKHLQNAKINATSIKIETALSSRVGKKKSIFSSQSCVKLTNFSYGCDFPPLSASFSSVPLPWVV